MPLWSNSRDSFFYSFVHSIIVFSKDLAKFQSITNIRNLMLVIDWNESREFDHSDTLIMT